MSLHSHRALLFQALALAGLLAGGAAAAIKAFSLEEMARTAEGCVAGRITAREGFLLKTRELGTLYMTRLTIQGKDLYTGAPATVKVCYFGGTVNGVTIRCSTQPPDRETAPGTRVVAFHRFEKAFGVRMLVAQFGGIFRIESGSRGDVVIGKGPGMAVSRNMLLADLEAALKAVRPAGKEGK